MEEDFVKLMSHLNLVLCSKPPSAANPSQFGIQQNSATGFAYNSASSSSGNNMEEDLVKLMSHLNLAFCSKPPSSTNIPSQFGIQQNSATGPQNPSPFQASGSLGWRFSVGTGGPDKNSRKIVRVCRTKARKKKKFMREYSSPIQKPKRRKNNCSFNGLFVAYTVQASSTPTVPVFGQTPVAPQSSFMFGSTPPPSAANPFQFGIQQNSVTPQNPSPFQASGSLGGSFSVGTGGTDKSARKIVRVNRNKSRKK